MSSTPWWVPLGAAAIALLGVMVGQLINAIIERRRQHREVAQRTFEYWRDKKLEIYAELLSFMKRWREVLLKAIHATDEGQRPLPEGIKQELDGYLAARFDQQGAVDLIPADEITQAALSSALTEYATLCGYLVIGRTPPGADPYDTHSILDDIISAIRIDLGIPRDRDVTRFARSELDQ